MQGILYSITLQQPLKRYIGLTVNFSRRKVEHLTDLRKNRHFNTHLQAAWNKYGEKAFKFEILKQVWGSRSQLNQAEIKLIEEFKTTQPKYGYNKSKGGYTSKWRPINQYSKSGQFISYYATAAIAAATLAKLATPIWKALNGVIPTAHSYQWRYCDDKRPVRSQIGNHAFRGVVYQVDQQGRLVKTFASAMEAGKALLALTEAKSYKSVAINIRKVCYGQMGHYMGYRWFFEKDFLQWQKDKDIK